VPPARLVLSEHGPDRLVAGLVAAETLERRGDRELLGAGAEHLGELEA
jgi:hypothetical protein